MWNVGDEHPIPMPLHSKRHSFSLYFPRETVSFSRRMRWFLVQNALVSRAEYKTFSCRVRSVFGRKVPHFYREHTSVSIIIGYRADTLRGLFSSTQPHQRGHRHLITPSSAFHGARQGDAYPYGKDAKEDAGRHIQGR